MKSQYKLIGEGSYGCVIKPSVPCDKDKEVYVNSINKNRISKIFKEDGPDFLFEKATAKKLAKIDEHEQFFIYPYESCSINRTTLNKINPRNECIDEVDPTLTKIPQMILPYAGYNLYELFNNYSGAYKTNMSDPIKFPANVWIIMLQNLFLGIQLLIKNNIIHQDIYASNILYNPNDHKLRFVDFGLSLDSNKIFNLSNERLTYPYHCYPPEYMFSILFKNKIYNPLFESIFNLWMDSYICPNINTPDCYKYYPEYLNNDQLKYELKIVLQDYINDPLNWLSRMSKYTHLLDLYAIGMLCIDVHERLDFSILSKSQYERYKTLVLGLMNPNYHKRFGFDKSYKYYLRLLNSIQRI